MSQVFYLVTGGAPLIFCHDFKKRHLASRDDMIVMMKEFIARAEGRYAEQGGQA